MAAIDLIWQTNAFPTSFNTDWSIEYGNESNDYLLRSIPRAFQNSTCTCVTSNQCRQPLRIGPPGLLLPGLVVGCSPMDGLRMSTLECFFSSDCINIILNYLDYYTQIDGSPPTDFVPPVEPTLIVAALNSSTPPRFSSDTPIGQLIDDLFIEEWLNTSTYESYFATCAPSTCQYQNAETHNVWYVITSLLGLYGGLTVTLRFIVWNSVQFYQKIKRRFHFRRIKVTIINE
ncbi:unnamed protein product [Rotaria sp. Silwood1]|nr:unnamed protein product [Rotaria sp. Silwood1]CAF1658021.1 unnamed protein product [Rotaria sp. Silwood1]